MSVENKGKVLKRSHPDKEDDQHVRQTEQMLTNVINALEAQKDVQGQTGSKESDTCLSEQGAVPPPNTPCTKD